MDKTSIIVFVVGGAIILGLVAYYVHWRDTPKYEGYHYFQNYGPYLDTERVYYGCLKGCNSTDEWCKQKCYLTSQKAGSPPDRCDLVCYSEFTPESKMECLDECYGRYNRPLLRDW